uniref:Putative WRKY transcription factor 70 n=1 Tax=Lilium longiflorum TaxID=4690 RepID=A0A6G8D8Y6_LILLO|nr:putative WRKY transcription factor 70 [Lilium longiflorum]
MRDMEAWDKLEGSSSPPPDWKVTVEALIRGARDSASLLSCQLQDQASGSPTRVLAEGIIHSISSALLVLDDCEKTAVPWTTNPLQASSDDRQNEVSSGKRKITRGRRAYRSRSLPNSCTTITAKTMKDAYSWRKYGQKRIYKATFPRCYYRCTHKPDRGCQATKQVQQSEEEPTMFVITYMGEHTCRSNPNKASTSESCFISFESRTTEPMMSAPLPIPKLDFDDEVVSSSSQPESSLSEELGFPETMAIEASAPPTLPLISQISFDFSRDYWEFDFMSKNEFINLDDMLNLENDGLS